MAAKGPKPKPLAERFWAKVAKAQLGTVLDNNADMRAKGRQNVGEAHSPFVRGEANACSKLTEDAVRAIRVAPGTLKQIGERFGVHFTTVSDVRRRKSWRHVEGAV